MRTTGSQILDRLLEDLASAFPVAAFVRALGEPAELSLQVAAPDFWQQELRSWIRADYGTRLEQVLRAYKSLDSQEPLPSR